MPAPVSAIARNDDETLKQGGRLLAQGMFVRCGDLLVLVDNQRCLVHRQADRPLADMPGFLPYRLASRG